MQLFVGVVVDQFNSIRAQKDGSATMTESQQQWVETMKSMSGTKVKARPKAGKARLDQALFWLLTHPIFPGVIAGVIALNTLVLTTDHWGFDQEVGLLQAAGEDGAGEGWYTHDVFTGLLTVFTLTFYVEMAMKLRAFGLTYYLGDEWTRFEGLLAVLAALHQANALQAFSSAVVPLPPLVLRAPSAAVALRAVRLVQHAKKLQGLVTTILMSIPSLINVTSLLALVVFIYSVLGVQLFTYTPRGLYFTESRNFDTFGNALLLNFQCLTGDGWSGLMNEARGTFADSASDGQVGAEGGGESDGHVGGSNAFAIPFFVSFQVLGTFVILNLVVAVILENFTSLGKGNTDLVSRADVELFSDTWAEFDPDANQCIPVEKLPDLLKAVPQPLGLQGAPRSWIVRVCLNLGLKSKDGELHFKDVLNTLVKVHTLHLTPQPAVADPSAALGDHQHPCLCFPCASC